MDPAPFWPGRRRSSCIWMSSSVSCMRGGTPSTMHPTPGTSTTRSDIRERSRVGAGPSLCVRPPSSSRYAEKRGTNKSETRARAQPRRAAGSRGAAAALTGAVALAERRDAEEGAKGRHAGCHSVLSLHLGVGLVQKPCVCSCNVGVHIRYKMNNSVPRSTSTSLVQIRHEFVRRLADFEKSAHLLKSIRV